MFSDVRVRGTERDRGTGAFGPIGTHEITSCDRTMREGRRSSRASPCTARTDYTQKVRFSATPDEEPEVEVGLV